MLKDHFDSRNGELPDWLIFMSQAKPLATFQHYLQNNILVKLFYYLLTAKTLKVIFHVGAKVQLQRPK